MGVSKIKDKYDACLQKLLKLPKSRNAGVKKSLIYHFPQYPSVLSRVLTHFFFDKLSQNSCIQFSEYLKLVPALQLDIHWEDNVLKVLLVHMHKSYSKGKGYIL